MLENNEYSMLTGSRFLGLSIRSIQLCGSNNQYPYCVTYFFWGCTSSSSVIGYLSSILSSNSSRFYFMYFETRYLDGQKFMIILFLWWNVFFLNHYALCIVCLHFLFCLKFCLILLLIYQFSFTFLGILFWFVVALDFPVTCKQCVV